MDAFSLPTPEETKPIIKYLTILVEKVNGTDLDSNVKLLEWSKRKFQNKVNEKISSAIALSQVELLTKIDYVKKVIEKKLSL